MTFFSLGLAHLIEQGEGPVLPPIHEPSISSGTRSYMERGSLPGAGTSSSQVARREGQDGSHVNDMRSNGDDSSAAMQLIFAFS